MSRTKLSQCLARAPPLRKAMEDSDWAKVQDGIQSLQAEYADVAIEFGERMSEKAKVIMQIYYTVCAFVTFQEENRSPV